VTRLTAKTELRLRRGAPLASAGAAERRKHKSYDAACERDGSTMVPFALESGAKGKPAQRLLLKLPDASEELSAQAFLLHASAALSVALQCGNADIATRGTQALRTRQAAESSLFRTALAMSLLGDATASSRRSHPASMTTTTTTTIFRWVPLSTHRCWLPKQQLCALQLQLSLRTRMRAALARSAFSLLRAQSGSSYTNYQSHTLNKI